MDWNLQKPPIELKPKPKADGQPLPPVGAAIQPEQAPGYTMPDIEQSPAQREQYAAQMAFRQQTATQLLAAVRELTVRVILARNELPPLVRQELYDGLVTAAGWLGGVVHGEIHA